MKRIIKYVLLTIILIPSSVFAAGSLNVASSVELGSTVTASFTVSGVAAWDVSINSSGATSGCSQHFADTTTNGKNTTKTFTVKCKATSLGTIGFVVSGDVTSESGNQSEVSASKRVTVTPPREKSNDNNLASLKIDGYDLNPEFSKDTLEYSVNVPSTVEKIKITAKQNESHATIQGDGEFEVSEGLNPFSIVVTSETGKEKTYTINVNVLDENPIKVNLDNSEYTIIKNSKNITKPEFYEEKEVTINGFTIPAFYNEVTNFTLVALKDNENNISFAIYNEENNEYKIYNEIKGNSLVLYLVDFKEELPGYIKGTENILGKDVSIYRKDNGSRFVICYGMDITSGKYDYYRYDTIGNTFQAWNLEDKTISQNEFNNYIYICIAFGVVLLVSLVLNIALLRKRGKKNKKATKKDDKIDKNKNKDKEELQELFQEYDEKQKNSKLAKFEKFNIDEEE